MCKSFWVMFWFGFGSFGWLVSVFGFLHHLFVQTIRVENNVKIERVKESQQEEQYLFTISNS